MGKRGFMIIDATIASVILSFVMVSIIVLFLLSIRANTDSDRTTTAAQLSIRLLEEVQLRKWDELTPTPRASIKNGSSNLGPDNGEDSADKRTFDDIDDFDGWVENPPKDPMMNVLSQFSVYSSSVAVQYTNANLVPQSGRSNYKKISVCTWAAKIKNTAMKSVCLYTIRTNR